MTTIVCVRRNGEVAIGGDGQVTLGNTIMKGNAQKIRSIYNGQVMVGFAGGTADAFTLFERFERKLETHQGNLSKAAVELAKDWRSDRILRRLEAILAVADKEESLIITGNGDVIKPEKHQDSYIATENSEWELIATGSGGPYAQAAARAFLESTGLSALEIAKKALTIAAEICIYTNNNFHFYELTKDGVTSKEPITC